MLFRETNDYDLDTETIHTIKKVHYNRPSDIAIIELQDSVNKCSLIETESGKCWPIKPVILGTEDLEITLNQTARALGGNTEIIQIITLSIIKVGVSMKQDLTRMISARLT